MWCGVVWCGVVWCGVAWRGVAWRGVAWRGVVWHGTARHGTAWHHGGVAVAMAAVRWGRRGGLPRTLASRDQPLALLSPACFSPAWWLKSPAGLPDTVKQDLSRLASLRRGGARNTT